MFGDDLKFLKSVTDVKLSDFFSVCVQAPFFNFAKISKEGGRGLQRAFPWRFAWGLGSHIESIFVGRAAVLSSGLFIVAWLAQALPVLLVPEQRHVAAMRSDVINHRCLRVFAMSHTLCAKRMLFKVHLACCPPSAVVASLACRAGSFGMHTQVFPAILITH